MEGVCLYMSSFPICDSLLISDLDGTLLNKNKEVSNNNIKIIKKWIDLGGLFTIATGRNLKSAYNRIKNIPINCPAILLNGCCLYDYNKREFINVSYLDNYLKPIEFVINNYKEAGVEFILKDDIFVINNNDITNNHLSKEGLSFLNKSFDEIEEKGTIKILIGIKNELIDKLQKELNDILPPSIYSVQTDPQYLELLPTGVNKGYALEKLKKSFNIKHVIAFGDYYNDIEMIKFADIGFAMENAPQDVKDVGDFISINNENDGIYHSISKLIDKKIII